MSDGEIREAVQKGELKIRNLDEKQIKPASYDARVGKIAFKTRPEKGEVDISKKGLIIIGIGEFAVLTTEEYFEMPANIAGQIGLRSYYARKGLILLSGPQIDPGFRGLLSLGFYNVGPRDVAIPYLEPLCTIGFHKLHTPATEPYQGEYQDQRTIPLRDIEFFAEAKGATLAEVIQTIAALSNSIQGLEATVKGIKISLYAVPLITTLAVSIVVGVVLLCT